MRELVERSTTQRRFVMLLLAGFAVAALLLAGVGIYGTVSQAVAQRTQEIGVRMALGASPGAVLRLVFGEGVRMMGAGLVLGGVAAAGLAGSCAVCCSPWGRWIRRLFSWPSPLSLSSRSPLATCRRGAPRV
jgi:ABC-type antimicrobial peptide transport system permease subunit